MDREKAGLRQGVQDSPTQRQPPTSTGIRENSCAPANTQEAGQHPRLQPKQWLCDMTQHCSVPPLLQMSQINTLGHPAPVSDLAPPCVLEEPCVSPEGVTAVCALSLPVTASLLSAPLCREPELHQLLSFSEPLLQYFSMKTF